MTAASRRPTPRRAAVTTAATSRRAKLTADIAEMLGEIPGSGCLLLGDQGTIFSPDDYGEQFFVKLNGEKKFTHFKKHPAVAPIPQVIPRNPFTGDNDQRHHLEWIAAIKDNKPENCYSRFAIGAPLHGNHAARLRRAARRQKNRVGRPGHARHQFSRSRAVHQARKPRGLEDGNLNLPLTLYTG